MTSNGYNPFLKQASIYDYEWCNFDRARHKVPADEDDETPSYLPHQSHDKTRYLKNNPREVHSIPIQYLDLEPLKTIPITSYLNIQRLKKSIKYVCGKGLPQTSQAIPSQ